METLTLILHKSKETKNKVVYGTKDGSVIQSVKGVDKTYQWGGAKMYHQRGHWPA